MRISDWSSDVCSSDLLAVIACDLEPELSAACHLADRRFAVPPVTSADYVDAVLEICRTYEVGLVVPTSDPELLPLSLARGRFEQIGASVPVSSPVLAEIARGKLETARLRARPSLHPPPP